VCFSKRPRGGSLSRKGGGTHGGGEKRVWRSLKLEGGKKKTGVVLEQENTITPGWGVVGVDQTKNDKNLQKPQRNQNQLFVGWGEGSPFFCVETTMVPKTGKRQGSKSN